MYFIVKGKVIFEVQDFEDIISIKEVSEGYYFGEMDIFLSNDQTRYHSVKAMTKTKLLSLSKHNL